MKLNHYETTVIIHPSLAKGQVATIIQKYKKLLKQEGGKLIHEENEGTLNLAYPIQKQTSGTYYTMQYEAPGTFIEKLERAYRIDEHIIRFLSVKLDKHAIKYYDNKRKEAKKQATEEQSTETTTTKDNDTTKP